MGKLYFKVAADWQEVEKLRKEIDKLKSTLKGMNSAENPSAFKELNTQLGETEKKMDNIVSEAARAGAAVEKGFKRKIFDASQVVNGLSEKITLQRGVIQQLKTELAGLKVRYKEALSTGADVSGISAQIKEISGQLMKQKGVLFDLTQQQADARLSVKRLRDEYELYRDDGNDTQETNEDIAKSFGKILGAIGGVTALKSFVSELVNVRGEFQQLEIAFGTMLKSKEKADALMSELVAIAAKTPFDLQGVASSAKQMLAYGSSAENVGKELVMLGNVAAGVGSQLSEIAYLYGTLRTQGRAYTVDIKQFAGRGIPIYEELAKVLGVSKDKVNELVTAGKVGFAEVEKAFQAMTSASGIYYNLMEEQSKSLTGQLSNLSDSWDSMLNDIGKSTQGLASASISAAGAIVENYEKIGKVIAGLVITYGAYKAAVITNIALTHSWAVAARADATAKGLQAVATNALIVKQKILNSVMKANPYVVLATAIVGVTTAMWAMADASDAAAEAQQELGESFARSESSSMKEERRLAELKGKLSALKKDTQEYKDVKDEIIKDYGKYYDGLKEEIEKVGLTEAAYKKLTAAMRESYMERGHADYIRKAGANMDGAVTGKLAEVQKRLYEQLGDEEGAAVYTKLRDLLLERKLGKGKGFGTITGIDKALQDALNRASGGGLFTNRAIENRIREAIDAQNLYDKSLEQAKELFKASPKKEEKEEEKPDSLFSEDYKKAEQEYLAKKKAFEALEKSKAGTTKEYLKAKEEFEAAEKEFNNLGGKTDEKTNRRKENDTNAALKRETEAGKELLQLKRQNKKAEIALENDATEKLLKQADLNYEVRAQRTEELREKWMKEQDGKLTEEQKNSLAASEEASYKEYEAAVNEALELQKKTEEKRLSEQQRAWDEYFIAYGSYQEKRVAITNKYAAEMQGLDSESPEWKTLFNKQKEELDALDSELMDKSGLWGDFFSDFSNRSSSAIRSLIKDIEQLIDYMNGVEGVEMPDVFKSDAKAVKAINDALSNPEATKKFTDNLLSSVGKFKKMLDKNNPFKQISEGFKNKDSKSLSEGLGGIAAAANQLGGVLEDLGVSADNAAGKIVSAFGSAASMAAQGAEIGGPWGAAIGGALGIAGGLTKMFGADYSSYNRMVEEYNNLGKIWDMLIGKKKEYIDISYGAEALQAGEEALDLIMRSQQAQRELAAERAKAGKSAGSHSIAYRQNKNLAGYADELYKYTSQKGNYDDITNALLGADVEELKAIRENMQVFWAKLDSEFQEHLNNIIAGSEKAEEVAAQMKESVTGISFDQFHDSYIDMLMDLDSTNKDFADNFGEMLQNAIMQKMFAETYRDKIKKLYDAWNEAGKDGLTPDEVESLKQQQHELVGQMIASRDELKDTFGWTDKEQQEGTKRGFGSEMTHEDAGELSGRFAALQVTGEGIKTESMAQSASLNLLSTKADAILACNTGIKNIANDTLMLIANSYTELQQISSNTGEIIEPIRRMQKDMEQIKKNTQKL